MGAGPRGGAVAATEATVDRLVGLNGNLGR